MSYTLRTIGIKPTDNPIELWSDVLAGKFCRLDTTKPYACITYVEGDGVVRDYTLHFNGRVPTPADDYEHVTATSSHSFSHARQAAWTKAATIHGRLFYKDYERLSKRGNDYVCELWLGLSVSYS